MGVADHLPDPAVRLGKADHGQRVVLVPFRDVDGHVFIEPVVTPNEIGHAAEGLENHVAVLSDEKLVELLGSVGGRTVIAVLAQRFHAAESKHQKNNGEETNHLGLSSELCGKAPASP